MKKELWISGEIENLRQEVDLQIQFIQEPINSLMFRGTVEKAFRFFLETHIPEGKLFSI